MADFLGTHAWQAALGGLAWTVAAALATWAVSLARRDASLVDRVWGPMIAGAGVVYALRLDSASGGGAPWWVIGVAAAWAARLAIYITLRNWGHGEDRRYQAMRERHGERFGIRSLYLVFGLQAVLAWVVSAPLFAAVAFFRPGTAWQALPGLALAVFGLVFEAVGDAQMARFKRQGGHGDRVMDQGLWRYTRHPNYFGEACVWWGLWLAAVGMAGMPAFWSIVSPVLMTTLLLRVSGVALLEKDMHSRRPAYREYQRRTSAFIPMPPRSGRPS
ncbi:hypothetical protein C8241_16130 [Paracidovorax avenae]|uniref:DUF1295 domain-containing protein n=1 Tax=Paracidovorax avenae TaxID=80867 RepID=UPI000D17779A|nr:DUF1295 domain-containing protein [Paracidovorax avenae]AVS63004.1 hypothetical protein C8241_16130 [Paracidovorax avenae]